MQLNRKTSAQNEVVFKKKSLFKEIAKKKTIYAMLAPNVILFTALSIYPIFWVFKYMFYEYDGIHEMKFVGLDNFVRVFTRDTEFWHTVINTFVYVGGKLLLTLPLAFILALILNRKFRGSGALQAVVFSPTIMSAAVMSLIFYLLFNAYNGEVNRMLINIGLIKTPINWLGEKHAMLTVIIVGAWGAIGNYMVYFLAGLQSISSEVYESADLDGVNGFQRMFYITLPMLGPVLKVILMISIVNAFNDMQSIMVLTEGGPVGATNVMFLYIYQFFFPISVSSPVNPEFGYGAAVSVVAAVIIGIVTGIYLIFSRKLDEVY
jgi:raffinose/stachyose/melibiose transport system permease protein